MRFVILGLVALALAACDSGSVPSPTERLSETGGANQGVIVDGVEVRGDGLAAGAEAFFFSAGQNEVTAAVTKVLGEPIDINSNEECGAGAMDFTSFEGGLIVNFQQGAMVGWNLGRSETGSASKVAFAGDVQIGSRRETAQSTGGFVPFAESTLGEEFSLGSKIGGFIEEDTVSMMYAGTQCFFR